MIRDLMATSETFGTMTNVTESSSQFGISRMNNDIWGNSQRRSSDRRSIRISKRYKRPSLPPAVRAHSRQNRTPDKTPAGDRLATKATAGALHWRKCQQFWLAHSQTPRERKRAAAFMASLNSGRTLRRRSRPSRAFSRRSLSGASTTSGGGDSLTQPSCRLNR